jgi:hypothetical protein
MDPIKRLPSLFRSLSSSRRRRRLFVEHLESRHLLATFGPASVAELITAINTANSNNAVDTIDLGGGTFTLTVEDNATNGDNGLPSILADSGNALTIQNGTIQRATAGGTPEFRILYVSAEADLTLDNVTIINGAAAGAGIGKYGGGIFNLFGTLSVTNSTVSGNSAWNGGGISSVGTLSVANSTVSGNTATWGGGVGTRGGTATVTNSTVSGNTAQQGGGGFYSYGLYYGEELSVADSTISGNSAQWSGGGFYNYSTLSVTNSTISGNSARSDGGGLFNYGYGFCCRHATMSVSNSTVSGNSAGHGGGGIDSFGVLSVNNSTVSGNSASWGGGISFRYASWLRDKVNSNNTIVTMNAAPSGTDIWTGGHSISGDHNLIGDGTGGTVTGSNNQVGTEASPIDPLLGPLQDNGGPTFTQALLSGSPAIDAGTCTASVTTDQRGALRPQGSTCDIGAFEVNLPAAVSQAVSDAGLDTSTAPQGLIDALVAANAASQLTTLPTSSEDSVTIPSNGARVVPQGGSLSGSIDGSGGSSTAVVGTNATVDGSVSNVSNVALASGSRVTGSVTDAVAVTILADQPVSVDGSVGATELQLSAEATASVSGDGTFSQLVLGDESSLTIANVVASEVLLSPGATAVVNGNGQFSQLVLGDDASLAIDGNLDIQDMVSLAAC